MNVLKNVIKLLALLGISKFLVACGGGVAGDNSNFVIVDDQTQIHLNQIIIRNATVEKPVWIVVTELGNTKILGKKRIETSSDNIIVILDRDTKDNEILLVELRNDFGETGVLDDLSIDTVITQSTVSAVSLVVKHSNSPYLEVQNLVAPNPVELLIRKIVASKPAWLVVFRDESGNPGEIIGFQKVDAGHTSQLSVRLAETIQNNEKLVIGLYENVDDTEDDNFDAQQDTLFELNGEALQYFVTVTLNSLSSPQSGIQVGICDECVHYNLTASNDAVYIWSLNQADKDVRSKPFAGNDTIELQIGQRYEIINEFPITHPFELVGDDGVLLSQATDLEVSFESDPAVDWFDVAGIMRFTLTPELADALKRYRCQRHSLMNGSFDILP